MYLPCIGTCALSQCSQGRIATQMYKPAIKGIRIQIKKVTFTAAQGWFQMSSVDSILIKLAIINWSHKEKNKAEKQFCTMQGVSSFILKNKV